MNSQELKRILEDHQNWSQNNGGKQANLRGVDLRRANLRWANLRWANLRRADLSGADLSGADLNEAILSQANLIGADLNGADLREANLSRAHLSGADLSWADLSGADLRWADLIGADLSWADLSGVDLSWANLSRADLVGADLSGADLNKTKIEFYLFPSIRLLSSMPLGELSDKLTLELMRHDAYAHPYPEKFDEWAKGGICPYKDEETFWQFTVKPKLWRKGKPQMTNRDLILAICKEKGWGIRGHLQAEARWED